MTSTFHTILLQCLNGLDFILEYLSPPGNRSSYKFIIDQLTTPWSNDETFNISLLKRFLSIFLNQVSQ